MKFRKIPVVVEAVQYTGSNRQELAAFAGHWIDVSGDAVYVTTPSGPVRVETGDWLIKQSDSDYYPCKANVFAAVYEPVS